MMCKEETKMSKKENGKKIFKRKNGEKKGQYRAKMENRDR